MTKELLTLVRDTAKELADRGLVKLSERPGFRATKKGKAPHTEYVATGM